jgi:hypothetical protein
MGLIARATKLADGVRVLGHKFMSTYFKAVLADLRPRGFQGRGDKYLAEVAQGLRRVLWKTQQQFHYPTCRLKESEWNHLALLLTEWAEDIHNDIGLWRTVEAHQQQCFGTPLPFVLSAAQGDELRGFDPRRIQFLLWSLWPCFNTDRILSPTHGDLARVAEAAGQFLTERFAYLPQDSGIKHFLATSNQYGWDIKRKLIWLGTCSYLFRFLFVEYLADQQVEQSPGETDDFVCQHCTEWCGLGVIDVLAGALDLTETEREALRTWYARHASFYRVLTWQEEAGEVKCITARNVVNGQPYTIRMNAESAACPFKPGLMVFGGLTPWRGEWYWSGEQKMWDTMPESAEPNLRKEMLEGSSAIAYRYCAAEAAKAREFTREHRAKFVAHYGGDLTMFPDGLTLAAAEQRRMEAEWAATDPQKVAQSMQAQGLPHPRPRMSFPPEFLKHDQGIGAFFNPEEGIEFLLLFNQVRSGLEKKGVGLNEDELRALQGLITGEAISPAFVRRLVAEHGVDSIAEAFLLRDAPSDLALDFLLRRYKGHFYRTRYPTLSLRGQLPPQGH